jgi:hypothetical protein
LIVVAVTHLQLAWVLARYRAADALWLFERVALADHAANIGLHFVAVMVAALLFARVTTLCAREVLRVRAYTLGPISHLYAWWTMYRWLRERHPAAQRPEAWALMSFTVEWGLSFVLSYYFRTPLQDAVRGILPG